MKLEPIMGIDTDYANEKRKEREEKFKQKIEKVEKCKCKLKKM